VQLFESRVHFRCPACRHHNVQNVEVPELDYSADSPSDFTSQGDATLWCEACESEFPSSVWCNGSYCQFTLDDYPQIKLTGDAPFYSQDQNDYWIDYDPPDDPFAICLTTLDQIGSLLTDKPTHKDDPQLLNRMLFSQAITALETYLFDTLMRRVTSDRDVLVRLANRDRLLSQEKFTLQTLANNQLLLEEHTRKYLGGVLYHNLERVNFLFEAAFGFSMKENDSSWELLLEAVRYRHDCVHRNGMNSEGQKLLIFGREYVGQAIGAIQGFVRRIELKIAPAADDDCLPL
jgi:hypothetical protein